MNEHVARKAVEQRDIVLAAWSNSSSAVSQLLSIGVDSNSTPSSGSSLAHRRVSALFFAARYGNADMLRDLLQHGADVNFRGLKGNVSLLEAADNNAPGGQLPWATLSRTMSLLLDYGADPCLCDESGRSILHLLANHDRPDCDQLIDLLIERGADVNLKDKDGWTPLHSVAFFGSEQAARTLIRHGADVNAVDEDGKTALMVAAKHGGKLLTVNQDGRNVLVPGDSTEHVKIVQLLISAGTDLTAKNRDGKNALDLAQEGGHQALVELLSGSNHSSNGDRHIAAPPHLRVEPKSYTEI